MSSFKQWRYIWNIILPTIVPVCVWYVSTWYVYYDFIKHVLLNIQLDFYSEGEGMILFRQKSRSFDGDMFLISLYMVYSVWNMLSVSSLCLFYFFIIDLPQILFMFTVRLFIILIFTTLLCKWHKNQAYICRQSDRW